MWMGENAKSFSMDPISMGEGISGWVAQSGKPILNGNAALEKSYKSKFGCSGELRAALSIPLVGFEQDVFGVLTLYSMTADGFDRDHLRILLAMSSKLGLSVPEFVALPARGNEMRRRISLPGCPMRADCFCSWTASSRSVNRRGTGWWWSCAT